MKVRGDFDSRWTFEVLESKEEVSEKLKTERPLMRFWERDAPEEVGKVLWLRRRDSRVPVAVKQYRHTNLYLVSRSELVDLTSSAN